MMSCLVFLPCFTTICRKSLKNRGNYIQNLPAWKRKLTCDDISARWISRENHGGCQNLLYPYNPCMVYLYIYIWLIFMVNIGKYTIHGWYGINDTMNLSPSFKVYCMRHPGGHFSRDYRIIGKYTVNLWTFTRIDWKKWSANPNHPKSSIVSTMCFG